MAEQSDLGWFGLPMQSGTGPSWGGISQGIAAVAQALLSGNRMSPLQAIGTGIAAGNEGALNARQQAVADALHGMQMKRYQQEQDRYQQEQAQQVARQKAIDDYIASAAADQQPQLRAAAATGALDSVIGEQYKPFRPNVEHITKGSSDEFGYWDRQGKWVSLGIGPRWQPQQPGADAGAWETVDLPGVGKVQRNRRTGKVEGLPGTNGPTQAQQANDAEIDAARQYLNNSGMSFDDILGRSQQYSADGMPNPDYDPYISSAYRSALQHKVGPDPEFDATQKRLRRGGSTSATSSVNRGSGTQTDPFTPTTAAEFGVIKSGEYYTDPGDGQLYRKK